MTANISGIAYDGPKLLYRSLQEASAIVLLLRISFRLTDSVQTVPQEEVSGLTTQPKNPERYGSLTR